MECVQKLASTTFVQTVTAAPLALIAPLLLLGRAAQVDTTLTPCWPRLVPALEAKT